MEELMTSKCADRDLQLDVDIMSLDFLVHRAVTFVLADRKRQQGGLLADKDSADTTERALTAVDSKIHFSSLFSTHTCYLPALLPSFTIYTMTRTM